MSLTHVCIEVRRKLQCANIYLTFANNIAQCEDAVKILLKPNEITIKYDADLAVINLSPFFSIDQHSISSLVIEENNISFRVLLSTETGSLELLFDEEVESAEDKCLPKDAIEVTIVKETIYQLKCLNCENYLLSERRSFSRVLELPLEFVEMGEWFCHKHEHVKHDLTPKPTDVFFGLYFIVINVENVCNVIVKEKCIYCKRCLKLLGESTNGNRAIKLWNDCAQLDADGTNQRLFSDNGVGSVCRLLFKIIKETLTTTKLHSTQFVKVLLEATFPNRQMNFLMLNIMERNLDVLVNFDLDRGKKINVVERKAMKVLFKVENSTGNALVDFWRNDFSVQNVTVSHQMFAKFAALLRQNMKIIPPTYRCNNGFCFSYYFN